LADPVLINNILEKIYRRLEPPLREKSADNLPLDLTLYIGKQNKREKLTWMSRNFSARTGGPWSMGVPDPLKDLPSISIEIGMRKTSPVNSTCVCKLSMPEVPSKIYTIMSR
jgi:hypothetical protein